MSNHLPPERREPTKPQLLDIGFRLMGFKFDDKMTDLIYEIVTELNKKGGNLSMLDTARIQAANELKFMPPSKKYAHMKGKRLKPSMYR